MLPRVVVSACAEDQYHERAEAQPENLNHLRPPMNRKPTTPRPTSQGSIDVIEVVDNGRAPVTAPPEVTAYPGACRTICPLGFITVPGCMALSSASVNPCLMSEAARFAYAAVLAAGTVICVAGLENVGGVVPPGLAHMAGYSEQRSADEAPLDDTVDVPPCAAHAAAS